MAQLDLRDTVIELRKIVSNTNEDLDFDEIIEEISKESIIPFDDIVEMTNLIAMWEHQKTLPNVRKAWGGKKPWVDAEEKFLLVYFELSSLLNENASKAQICLELGEITDRTQEAISFKYYDLLKQEKTPKQHKPRGRKKRLGKKTGEQLAIDELHDKESLNLLTSSEVGYAKPSLEASKIAEIPAEIHEQAVGYRNVQPSNGEEFDLIDAMSQLVNNVETVGININPFLKGLLEMSNKAVENSNTNKVQELNYKVESLNKELFEKKIQLAQLNKEYMKLKQEVEKFTDLSSRDKLLHLNTFNFKIKDMVDKLGESSAVKIDKD